MSIERTILDTEPGETLTLVTVAILAMTLFLMALGCALVRRGRDGRR